MAVKALIVAMNNRCAMQFRQASGLSGKDFPYVSRRSQMMGLERGTLVLLVDGWGQRDDALGLAEEMELRDFQMVDVGWRKRA